MHLENDDGVEEPEPGRQREVVGSHLQQELVPKVQDVIVMLGDITSLLGVGGVELVEQLEKFIFQCLLDVHVFWGDEEGEEGKGSDHSGVEVHPVHEHVHLGG